MRGFVLPTLVLLAACGGLDNAPLRTGAVHGRVAEVANGEGFVAVLGDPATRATLDSTGTFSLSGLSAGSHELLVVAREDRALRLGIEVQPAQSTDLGTLTGRAAGKLEIKTSAPGHQQLGAGTVEVVGTPWTALQLGNGGTAEVKGVPRGCWTLDLTVPGLGSRRAEACLDEGETQQVTFVLPSPNGTEGLEGCRVSGCETGYTCELDGSCN